ncbi:MAG TPA: squalene/phytoene synthase family protein [Planctomycetota bacterium]
MALAGDLYPGPVLMPRGLLRAVDPILALALGPARAGGETLAAALENTLRGRPDGPLLLALWAAAAAGETPHAELREMTTLLGEPAPDRPRDRAALRAWLEPRIESVCRCALTVIQPRGDRSVELARDLGMGLVLTRRLGLLPASLGQGRQPLPLADLEACGVTQDELARAIPTPPVRRLLAAQAAWARTCLESGLPLQHRVGARLRRGIRAAVLRARALLKQLEDPRRDPFRRPVRLSAATRWSCALRAFFPLGAGAEDDGPDS